MTGTAAWPGDRVVRTFGSLGGGSITFTTVELTDLPEFSPADYRRIVGDEPDPFGTDQLGISWRAKSDHVGLTDEGRLIAHAGWVAATVRTESGATLEVLGLGSVVVHRDRRGHGAGRQLVAGTMEKMRERQVPMAVLFCRTERLLFYERLGWLPVEADVTVDQPDGTIVMPLLTCWVPLVEGAVMPAGRLRVEGLPF
jgi:predicted N-acetyltransferase YhbS